MAIPPHAGGARAERAQRLDGARRLEFCEKADQRIKRQHDRDCTALLPFPKVKR
jgi:hypothetical protein